MNRCYVSFRSILWWKTRTTCTTCHLFLNFFFFTQMLCINMGLKVSFIYKIGWANWALVWPLAFMNCLNVCCQRTFVRKSLGTITTHVRSLPFMNCCNMSSHHGLFWKALFAIFTFKWPFSLMNNCNMSVEVTVVSECCLTSSQCNLLRGIDNCSVAAWSVVQVL